MRPTPPTRTPSSSAEANRREPYRAIAPIPATTPMSTPSTTHLAAAGQARRGGTRRAVRTSSIDVVAPVPVQAIPALRPYMTRYAQKSPLMRRPANAEKGLVGSLAGCFAHESWLGWRGHDG